VALAAAADPPDIFTAYLDLIGDPTTSLGKLGESFFADPLPFLHQVLINQIGYGLTVVTALENATEGFFAGLMDLPVAFGQALDDLSSGDVSGASGVLAPALLAVVVTGINISDLSNITFDGPIGDLLTTFTIPRDIAEKVTEVVKVLTDTNVSVDMSDVIAGRVSDHIGMPIALTLAALGPMYQAAAGTAQNVTSSVDAVQTGDLPAAFGAVVDAPATIANDFLNGQYLLPIAISGAQITNVLNGATVLLPLDGALAPIREIGVELNYPDFYRVGPITVATPLYLLFGASPHVIESSGTPLAASFHNCRRIGRSNSPMRSARRRAARCRTPVRCWGTPARQK
jgi:hypothetical protein